MKSLKKVETGKGAKMRHEYDAGTPELQAKKERAKGLKRKGLDYLMQCRTITPEQYQAGIHYRACFQAMYSGCGHRSCLASHFMPDDLGRDQPSEYWEKMMGMADARTWHSRISGKLARYSFYARKPYHKIIEHVCGHDDWNLDDVAQACEISHKRTASRYVSQAFDALVAVVEELRKEFELTPSPIASGVANPIADCLGGG